MNTNLEYLKNVVFESKHRLRRIAFQISLAHSENPPGFDLVEVDEINATLEIVPIEPQLSHNANRKLRCSA